jgi:surface protein
MSALIASYKFNSGTDTWPIFNEGFTYNYTDTDNGDNTISRIITLADGDFPTSISFSGQTGLLEVDHLEVSNLTSLSWMFQDCTNLISVNASSWRTNNVTSMVRVFQNCQKLKTLDVTDWDVSKVITMYYLFFQCYELETIIGLDTWNTESLVDMASVFARCNKLKSLADIENWNVSSVTRADRMFYECKEITELDLSNWNLKVTHVVIPGNDGGEGLQAMFYGCEKLTSLNKSSLEKHFAKTQDNVL